MLWVYTLRYSEGSFYPGHTDDFPRRMAEHEAGQGDGYTASRRPVSLVWNEEFVTREEALAAELQIKGWGRAKKEALFRGDWDGLRSLAKKRFSR